MKMDKTDKMMCDCVILMRECERDCGEIWSEEDEEEEADDIERKSMVCFCHFR
jgi:hypothetical protein